MEIKPFGVEMWMNEFETTCELNLAETCVDSITLGELAGMTGSKDRICEDILDMRMDYGAIAGSLRLRQAIASLYQHLSAKQILTTHGTIGANALIYQALVGQGDHVITVAPTYQQHYSIPESLGANVELLPLRPENDFLPDLDELAALLRPDTRLVAINNPNNPTGALMNEDMLKSMVKIVAKSGAWLLSDEVYRGLDQTGTGFTTSVADLYPRGISTGGLSKPYSLAGLRVGWIAADWEVLDKVMLHRDYSTISVSPLSEYFAALALEHKDLLLKRAHGLIKTNLARLENWLETEDKMSWVAPKSGTTALLKYDLPMSSCDVCVALLDEQGVMLTPGSAMDMEGWLRIGFVNPTDVMRAGLERITRFLTCH